MYEKTQPEFQLGSRRNKSALMGILTFRQMADITAESGLSAAMSLVDLVKGYDLAPREVTVGVPDNGPSS